MNFNEKIVAKAINEYYCRKEKRERINTTGTCR